MILLKRTREETEVICVNCGGEYADSLLRCPYCSYENKIEADKQKANILKGYDKEAETIKKNAKGYTAKRTNQITKKIFLIIGVLAVLGALFTLGYFLVLRKMDERSYASVEENKKELDSMMLALDYEGMLEYMEKNDISIAYYDKYEQVLEIYMMYKNIASHDTDLYTYAGHMKQGDEERQAYNTEAWTFNVEVALTRILYDGYAVVRDYNRYGTDDVFLGNETCMEGLYDNTVAIFRRYGFTDEEIQEMGLGEDSQIWDELYQKLLDYYWEEIM